MSLCMSIGNEYCFSEVIHDEKVNDCLTSLYFSMLCNVQEEIDRLYLEFEKKYKELDEEQREIVKVEIAKILDIEYKPKVKKKER